MAYQTAHIERRVALTDQHGRTIEASPHLMVDHDSGRAVLAVDFASGAARFCIDLDRASTLLLIEALQSALAVWPSPADQAAAL
jgi:hypothetical protein